MGIVGDEEMAKKKKGAKKTADPSRYASKSSSNQPKAKEATSSISTHVILSRLLTASRR